MMQLKFILRKFQKWLQISGQKHLRDMDGIKIFAKNKKELKSLKQTIRIFSQDIEMELGIGKRKYSMLIREKEERKQLTKLKCLIRKT